MRSVPRPSRERLLSRARSLTVSAVEDVIMPHTQAMLSCEVSLAAIVAYRHAELSQVAAVALVIYSLYASAYLPCAVRALASANVFFDILLPEPHEAKRPVATIVVRVRIARLVDIISKLFLFV